MTISEILIVLKNSELFSKISIEDLELIYNATETVFLKKRGSFFLSRRKCLSSFRITFRSG